LPNVLFAGLSFSCGFLLLFILLQVGWSSSVGNGDAIPASDKKKSFREFLVAYECTKEKPKQSLRRISIDIHRIKNTNQIPMRTASKNQFRELVLWLH
jgi:hypothetical protein